jgi:hypothetical protein
VRNDGLVSQAGRANKEPKQTKDTGSEKGGPNGKKWGDEPQKSLSPFFSNLASSFYALPSIAVLCCAVQSALRKREQGQTRRREKKKNRGTSHGLSQKLLPPPLEFLPEATITAKSHRLPTPPGKRNQRKAITTTHWLRRV